MTVNAMVIPSKRLLMGDLLHVINSIQPRPFGGLLPGFVYRNIFSADESIHRASYTQLFCESTRVDALNARNAILFEVGAQRQASPPVAHHRRQFTHGKASYMWLI